MDQKVNLHSFINTNLNEQEKLMKKINKKYAELLHQAAIATGRKEAVGLLHKAAKLKTKFEEKARS